MIRIWGRTNSVNVQKVLWCCDELNLPFERIDAGMQFGRNTDGDFLALNPNGRVPMLEEDDFSLWESNSIMRYLVLQYGDGQTLYPASPRARASVDRWLDWTLSTLQPAERPVFWGLVRTPPTARDLAQIQADADALGRLWQILDQHLRGRHYAEAEAFSLADITLGAYARRWFGVAGVQKPDLPELRRWYDALARRPGFQRHVAPPLS